MRWWRRRWAVALYTGIAIAAVIGLAFVCIAIGVAWHVIAVLVLGGTARAGLRLTGLDPLGFALGSGENAKLDGSPASKPQGLGVWMCQWTLRTLPTGTRQAQRLGCASARPRSRTTPRTTPWSGILADRYLEEEDHMAQTKAQRSAAAKRAAATRKRNAAKKSALRKLGAQHAALAGA